MRNGKIGEYFAILMHSVYGVVFLFGDIFTFIYLTFFDGYAYTAWNWLFVIPANIFLSAIWPVYWGILYWVF